MELLYLWVYEWRGIIREQGYNFNGACQFEFKLKNSENLSHKEFTNQFIIQYCNSFLSIVSLE